MDGQLRATLPTPESRRPLRNARRRRDPVCTLISRAGAPYAAGIGRRRMMWVKFVSAHWQTQRASPPPMRCCEPPAALPTRGGENRPAACALNPRLSAGGASTDQLCTEPGIVLPLRARSPGKGAERLRWAGGVRAVHAACVRHYAAASTRFVAWLATRRRRLTHISRLRLTVSGCVRRAQPLSCRSQAARLPALRMGDSGAGNDGYRARSRPSVSSRAHGHRLQPHPPL